MVGSFAPEKNFEPKSTGLKSSRTTGVRHKSLEENHSAWIKERSLLGHMCSEETQKKILGSDILTEISARTKFLLQSLFWSLDQKR